MDKNTTVKFKRNIDVTVLNGEKAMMDFNTGKYYIIKGVGNVIWDMLNEEISVGEITNRLLKEYDVSEKECEKEVLAFLEKLSKADII